jgi:hypothetical protein
VITEPHGLARRMLMSTSMSKKSKRPTVEAADLENVVGGCGCCAPAAPCCAPAAPCCAPAYGAAAYGYGGYGGYGGYAGYGGYGYGRAGFEERGRFGWRR